MSLPLIPTCGKINQTVKQITSLHDAFFDHFQKGYLMVYIPIPHNYYSEAQVLYRAFSTKSSFHYGDFYHTIKLQATLLGVKG